MSGLFTPKGTDTRSSLQVLPKMVANNFSSLIEVNNDTKRGRTRNFKGNQSNLSQKSRESFRSHRGADKESQGCFKIFKPTAELSVERSMNKSI